MLEPLVSLSILLALTFASAGKFEVSKRSGQTHIAITWSDEKTDLVLLTQRFQAL